VLLHRALNSLLAVAALLLLASPCAEAAFPGANGKIAFGNGNGVILRTMNPDGSDNSSLTSTGGDRQPSYSADGKKVAFGRDRAGGVQNGIDIWVINSNGSGAVRLTNNASFNQQPAWSPDGTKIAFVTTRDDPDPLGCGLSGCNYEIYVMNSNGSAVTPLTTAPGFDVSPSWSPDGTKIAFTSNRDSNAEVYSMDADGTGQSDVSNNAASDGDPDWSPDGKKLVFTTDRDANTELYAMDANGANQTRITNNPTTIDNAPAWSPDGSKIVFQQLPNEGGHWDIYTINADSSAQTKLTDAPTSNSSTDPSWQPTYQIPKSAQSISTALIPSYRQTVSTTQCAARGGTVAGHKPPFGVWSCNPPGFIPGTVARFGIQAVGSATLTVVPGNPATVTDEADQAITVDLSDVRLGSATGADYDPNASGADVTLAVKLRLSDSLNGSFFSDPGTASDVELQVPVNCQGTVDAGIGADCSASTSADGVMPGAVQEGKNTLTSAFRMRLRDSGANGVRGDSDDREFAMQGLYTP
jgi:hypothetical protein